MYQFRSLKNVPLVWPLQLGCFVFLFIALHITIQGFKKSFHMCRAENHTREEFSHGAIRKDAESWEEYRELARQISVFEGIRKTLNEELTRIMLRRVLPGNCGYCPL